MTSANRGGQIVDAADGRRLELGKHLKSGGAGSIYLLPEAPTEVAKLYHPGFDVRQATRKLAAMLRATPNLPVIVEGGQRYIQIAWPTTTLHERNGPLCGFLMPTIDIAATCELELVLQDKQARAHGLPTGLGARATLAANLAAVIAELHAQHYYVVDLKPVNLRFYRQALYMALLDCDGLSVITPQERFHATQFTPDYLAPEFQSGRIPGDGEEQQDRFALAVIVFQLLNFGLHPFAGRPSGDHVPTDLPGRIAGRFYAYGRVPHPEITPMVSSTHALIPDELRNLFDLAFAGRGPRVRPSAAQWAEVLKDYARRAGGKLQVCGRNPEHQHFAGQACAACVRQGHIAQAAKQAAVAAKTRPGRKRRGKKGGATAVQRPPALARVLATPNPAMASTPVAAAQSSGAPGCLTFIVVLALIVWWLWPDSKPEAVVAPPASVSAAGTGQGTNAALPQAGLTDDQWDAELLKAGQLALAGKEEPFKAQVDKVKAAARVPYRMSADQRTRYNQALGIYNQFSRRSQEPRLPMSERLKALKEAYELNPYERGVAQEQAFMTAMDLPPLRAQAGKASVQDPKYHEYAERVRFVERAFSRSLRGAYIEDSKLHGPWLGLAMLYFERGQIDSAKGALAVFHSLPDSSRDFDVARLELLRKTWLQRDDYVRERWNILDAQAQVAAAMLNGSVVAPEVSDLAGKAWPAEPPPVKEEPPKAAKRSAKAKKPTH
jgi:hypothetical protein